MQNSPLTPARNHALLVTSASNPLTQDVQRFADELEAAGVTLIRRSCTRVQVNDLIFSMHKQLDFVVLAGGDGMLGAGAVALRDTGLPLGILALGAGNEVACHLDIPPDPIEAAAIILAGHKRRLNLGAVNGRPFFHVASVGLTVQDARHLSHAARRPMSRLRFVWKAMRLSLQSSRFAAVIRCGSTVHRVRTVQITIGNGHHHQIGTTPKGRPGEDDFLGVYSLEPRRRWHFLFLKRAFAARDNATVPEARITRSPVVEVVTRVPRPITADGEIVAMTPARFSILPRAVEVFVPALIPASIPDLITAPTSEPLDLAGAQPVFSGHDPRSPQQRLPARLPKLLRPRGRRP